MADKWPTVDQQVIWYAILHSLLHVHVPVQSLCQLLLKGTIILFAF